MCPSLSFSLIRALLSIYLLYFPNSYSYLSIGVLCFAGLLSCQRHLSKSACEVRDPTQPRPSWHVTVSNLSKNIWHPPWGPGKKYPTTSCQSSHIHPWLGLGLTSDTRPPSQTPILVRHLWQTHAFYNNSKIALQRWSDATRKSWQS